MKAFLEPLSNITALKNVAKCAAEQSGIVQLKGCIQPAKPHLIYALGSEFKYTLIVCSNEAVARQLALEYSFFDSRIMYYPARDVLFYQSDLKSKMISSDRLMALRKITDDEGGVFITTFDALMDRIESYEGFKSENIHLKLSQEADLTKIAKNLYKMGYERCDEVIEVGQYALRGGILDVYPIDYDMPIRIEFFGDEVDSIRMFDPISQESIKQGMVSVDIHAAGEVVLTDNERAAGIRRIKLEAKPLISKMRSEMKTKEAFNLKSLINEVINEVSYQMDGTSYEAFLTYFKENTISLLDYFPLSDTLVILDEPAHISESATLCEEEFDDAAKYRIEMGYMLPGQRKLRFTIEQTMDILSKYHTLALSDLGLASGVFDIRKNESVKTLSINPYNNSYEALLSDLVKYKEDDYKVILLSGSRSRAKRLADELTLEGINAYYSENYDKAPLNRQVMVSYGKMKKGVKYPEAKLAIITESDVFAREESKKKRKKGKKRTDYVSDFSQLKIGDYVVHESYGLGRYLGIEKIESGRTIKDYIKIAYANNEYLYIQAGQLSALQKYADSSAEGVTLNKLGGMEWAKTKEKVKTAVTDVAKELVELYAQRHNAKGYAFGPDTLWQREFEEKFPFEETLGQAKAIEDTKNDMQSAKIMDRLICGDVGYGKTEIAIRAAFKAAQENKQVVYLCPTTILAKQHYETFYERMKDTGVGIELLCRFRTPSQIKESLKRIKAGTADIVIGTHRVLSKDVVFHDLGLLVIDEEQRFGVKHKERIKQLRKNVDVISLSATPIPRTLHMSLIGIRDMSILDEAPLERMSVQTYVIEYNEEIIREAIRRECVRGGQVFYVYNRVKDIEEEADMLRKMLPDLNIVSAHGKLSERRLEDIMLRFIDGSIDVLVSTTIIETGLDIPNANTIIIQDADRFGLSQLYQLRGRVGRSNRTAYAFLMYKKDRMIKETAEKRLSAISEFTELGSGYKIAMRDLEIRGAGNVLGEKQHGHMQQVGYELYCKMLSAALSRLKGEEIIDDFDTEIKLSSSAFIPNDYVESENIKLSLYKEIGSLEDEEDAMKYEDGLIDRFGDIPKSVDALIKISLLRSKAHKCYITQINQKNANLNIEFYEQAKIDPAKLLEFVADNKDRIRVINNAGSTSLICTLMQRGKKKMMDPLEAAAGYIDELSKKVL